MEQETKKTPKKTTIGIALIPILFLMLFLFVTIYFYGEDPHLPLIMGSVVAAAVGIYLGYSWKDLEEYFINTITMSMQACLILMIIGILIGAWIMAGIVPSMIYYGLQILNPGIFLTATAIICSIVSIATGSAWTTAGTVGVALLGIGQGLGIPVQVTAGAIISGAYFGDKMSPLSDTTNLAPAMAGANLFDHIQHMVFTTGPSLLIALVIFTFLGFRYSGQELDQGQIQGILAALSEGFTINLFLLIPPLLVIAMVILKIPAIPGLLGGVLFGAIFFFVFQQGGEMSMSEAVAALLDILQNGYVSEIGHEMVDELLTNGGMQEMMWTVSLILCAMTFGGLMERIGALETLANSLLFFAKNTGSLVIVTIISCIICNIVASDQYLAIVIPGRMYKDEYRKRGLAPKNLSRVLEDAGTMTSPLVPWNTCGAFMSSTLGVHPFAYLPYCFMNLINPFVSIFLGFTGITMEKLPESELEKIREENAAM